VVGVGVPVLMDLMQLEEPNLARDTVGTAFLLVFLEHSNIMEVEVEVEGGLVILLPIWASVVKEVGGAVPTVDHLQKHLVKMVKGVVEVVLTLVIMV